MTLSSGSIFDFAVCVGLLLKGITARQGEAGELGGCPPSMVPTMERKS